MIAERLDHFTVLDAGADQKTDPGAVENEQHGGEDHEPDDDRDQPVAFDRDVAEDQRAAECRRQRQRDLHRSIHRDDELFGDDQAADGDQDLFQMLAVDRHDDDALERVTEDGSHRHGERDQRQQRERD